jgi:hypothetical protein
MLNPSGDSIKWHNIRKLKNIFIVKTWNHNFQVQNPGLPSPRDFDEKPLLSNKLQGLKRKP